MNRSCWASSPLFLLLLLPALAAAQEAELPEEKALRERRERAAQAVEQTWDGIERYGGGAEMTWEELRKLARRRLEVRPAWEQREPDPRPTVTGEDLDEALEIEELEAYRQRILARLAHLAPHRFELPKARRRARTRHRRLRFQIFDVRDLVDWTEDHVGPNVGLGVMIDTSGLRDTTRAKATMAFRDEDEDAGTGVDADKLIELIESKLGEEDEDGSVEYTDGRLIVRKTAQAIAKIEQVLAGLREAVGHLIDLELRIYRLPPAVFGRLRATSTALDEAGEQALTRAVAAGEAELLGQHHVIAQDGQLVNVRRGGSRSFVADLRVDQTGVLPVLNPIMNVLNEGLVIEVRPVLARERGLVLLDVSASLCQLAKPMATRQIQGLELELPRLPIARTSSTCWVPVGRGALLGGVFTADADDELATVIYVRPRIVKTR